MHHGGWAIGRSSIPVVAVVVDAEELLECEDKECRLILDTFAPDIHRKVWMVLP